MAARNITWWHNALALVTHSTQVGQTLTVTVNGINTDLTILHWHQPSGLLVVAIKNKPYRWQLFSPQPSSCWQWYSFAHDRTITLHSTPPRKKRSASQIFIPELRSPIGGRVLRILVKEGDCVTVGMPLIIIESMKMENEIRSPYNTFIKTVSLLPNDVVEADQVVLVFTNKGAPHGNKSTANE